MKVAVFEIKVANREKCAKPMVRARRVGQLCFLEEFLA